MISLFASLNDTLRVITPCVLLFLGAALGGYARHYRFIVEERVKNRQLTETAGRRAITFFRWSGPALTALGVLLLLLVLWHSQQ